MRNKHLSQTWNMIITTLLLPLGHIPFKKTKLMLPNNKNNA
jgi:hypothetical protein